MTHHVTHASVTAWLKKYMDAWETYDPTAIGDLFTEDAEYRWHPFDEPEVGRDAIVTAWLNPGGTASSRDVPGTYAGDLEPFVGNGNRAVAVGTCTYWTDATRSKVARIYYNNWLLEFAEDGKCCSFTEYYMAPRAS
jgi:ketosteroid isomerase-like protein